MVGTFQVKTNMDNFSVMAMAGKVEVGGVISLVPEMLHRIRAMTEVYGFYCRMTPVDIQKIINLMESLSLDVRSAKLLSIQMGGLGSVVRLSGNGT